MLCNFDCMLVFVHVLVGFIERFFDSRYFGDFCDADSVGDRNLFPRE